MAEIFRTCIVCKKKTSYFNLTRIVFNGNEILIQKDKKLNGRGAYICKNCDCIDKLAKTHALNRAFKKNFSDEIYKNLINNLKIS